LACQAATYTAGRVADQFAVRRWSRCVRRCCCWRC